MSTKCEKCKGSGFVIKKNPETQEETGYPCACRLDRDERDLLHRRLVSADIPPEFWEYTFENYLSLPISSILRTDNKPRLEIFKGFLDNPNTFLDRYKVLWIWGRDTSACHTSLAVIFATELLRKNHRIKFLSMQRFLDAFTNFDEKSEYFKALSSANGYILDDAFDTNRIVAKGEYTIIHLYNWLKDELTKGKYFICTSKIDVPEIDIKFAQSRNLLLKYSVSIEIKGTVRTT